MEHFRIITFMQDLYNTDASEKRRSELEQVSATLKIWNTAHRACTSLEEFIEVLGNSCNENCIAVIADASQKLLADIRAIAPKAEILLIVEEGIQSQIPPAELLANVSHYVSMNHGRLATNSLIAAIKKISSHEIFGAEKYLAYGTPLHYYVLSRSEDRQWFVERFMDYVASLNGIIRAGANEYARVAGEVLDELLMNAIWDANPQRSQQDRNHPVILHPDEAVHVEWGVDGAILALSIRDPFGTFRKETLLPYQDDVFGTRKKYMISINCNAPGAGIGLHMVMRRVSGLIVNLAGGSSTEVIALFDLNHSPRFLAKGPKIQHFFSL